MLRLRRPHGSDRARGSGGRRSGELRFRALCTAGRAAHLASREEHALDLFRRAGAAASHDEERVDALWGELLALIELERAEADETLRLLRTTVDLQTRGRLFERPPMGSATKPARRLDLRESDIAVA